MAKLVDKINDLIKLLNPDDDKILIIALQLKLEQINQDYLSKYEVSDRDISYAKNGFKKILNSWIEDDWRSNPRICKINKILKNKRNCNNCIHSILSDRHYKTPDYDNDKCDSCKNWEYKLKVELEKEEEKEEEKYNKVIPLEYYKQKALITKIQNKLNIIKKNGKL